MVTNVTIAQHQQLLAHHERIKRREEALSVAKKAFLEERTIERLGAVIEAQVQHQEEIEKLLAVTWETSEIQ